MPAIPADYMEIHYEELVDDRVQRCEAQPFLDHDLNYDRIRARLGRLRESNSSFREEINSAG